ncbi:MULTISPECIES: hypothetical protein [unclassified Methylophaga]|uniref:hypothetical protein n=1 Tax=unclassified Methylophaga TaxID=2629249 RepID=UPI000C924996|nr:MULTISPECIES: hypothetical protein [unclassified Methylophaga]MBN46294.1 hypothetical protein [Methylophaga sp.]|tara:strand:- start:42732 stop:43154 length:423 start_codon:yes stop_codon:yes gene_type:complete
MATPEFYFENLTFDFVTLTGDMNPGTGHQVEELSRPGVDGVSYRRIGRRGLPFQMKSVRDVINIADAYNLVHSYKDLQGQIIDIFDERGVDWYNIMVLRCQPRAPRYVDAMAGGLSGAANGYVVEVEWLLQMTETEWLSA